MIDSIRELAMSIAASPSAQVALAIGLVAVAAFVFFVTRVLRADHHHRTGDPGRTAPKSRSEKIAALEDETRRLKAALLVTDHERRFWRSTSLSMRDAAAETLEARGDTAMAGFLRRLDPFDVDADDASQTEQRQTPPLAVPVPDSSADTPIDAEVVETGLPQSAPATSATCTARSERARSIAAQDAIKAHVIGAMGAGLVPVPVVDVAAVIGLQVSMIQRLAGIYGADFDRALAKSLVLSLVTSMMPVLAASGLASMAKAVPGIGSAAGAAGGSITAGAVTWGVGYTFHRHFSGGGSLLDFSPAQARERFVQAVAYGRRAALALRPVRTPQTGSKPGVGQP